MKPRSFQRAALAAIRREFDSGNRSLLLTLATGLGKTICAAHLIPDFTKRGRVLFIAHRDELLDQAEQKIRAVTSQFVDREQGQRWADNESWGEFRAKITCASVQTLYAPMGDVSRVSRFDPKDFSLVILDEVHHYVAPAFRRVVQYFLDGNPSLKMVGLTATPNRKDGKALAKIIQKEAFRMDLRAGIDSGWLVPVRNLPLYIAGLDYSKVDASKGELNGSQLAQTMEFETPMQGIAGATYDHCENRQTIVFCVSKKQAERTAQILNRRDPGCARFVCDSTPDEERRATTQGYRAGTFRFLCNVGIYTEGADFPETGCIAMARPTLSTPLFTQMLGRATRTLPGILDGIDDPDEQYQLGIDGADTPSGLRRARIAESIKPDALVLDFVGNSGKHNVATVFDALAGEIDADELEEAKRIARAEQKARSVDDVFAEAKRLRREREEEEERQRRHIVATVSVELGNETDIFSANGYRGRAYVGKRDEPMTGKQKRGIHWRCHKLHRKAPDMSGWTKRDAGKYINQLERELRGPVKANADDGWLYGIG